MMEKLEIVAKRENLPQVTEFIDLQLEKINCELKKQLQLDIAVEEIYINIASYAYDGNEGPSEIIFDTVDNDNVSITFLDSGVPYNPLAKEDPDITLSAAERQIGGLGIFMVKQSMDDMKYEYKDGKNFLTLIKNIR
jgi:anti-sigma regulatory factor (Ser/Thr protein kinase)